MWQINTNSYRERIRQELAEQANAQFLYFLLQESIRLLEAKQQEFKKSLFWFHKDYRHIKNFIKRSQATIQAFKNLNKDTGRFQLSKLFASLASVHSLLRENCTEDGLLAFVSSCEEARRYSDFSGMVHYSIKSPIVKLCFELTTEFYQKRAAKLYQRVDELAMVPRIQATLGLDRIPQPVKQSVFYKIGQRSKIDSMWLDAAFPKRLATYNSTLHTRLSRHSNDSSTIVSVSYERSRDLRKQGSLCATNIQKSLSALCRIHEDSLLSDIEKAARKIKRFTLTQKTGRRSVIALVNELKSLHQFDHNRFLTLKSQDVFKLILQNIHTIEQNIKKRIDHLKSLKLMKVDLPILSLLENSFNELITNTQQQAHFYTAENQFIDASQSLPALKVDSDMQRSDDATEWKKLRLTLLEIAESYRIPIASHTAEGIAHLLDNLDKFIEHSQTNSVSGCLIDPEKLSSVSDLSTLVYFIFSRRYANHQAGDGQNVFMPVDFDKKRGLILNSHMQHSRFEGVLEILQELKATPLLHYSVLLVVLAMMQESRTSKEYSLLYLLLSSMLNHGFAAYVSDYHAYPKSKHWVMDYLPYAIEVRPNQQATQFVHTRLLGNGYVTESTIFPQPKYAVDENTSRKVSVDLDMLSGSPEVHRGSLSQSSLRNSLVLFSSSPERRKVSIDRLEDVCSQLVTHAKSIMSKHQDYVVMADYQQKNPIGYNSIRILHQRAEENGHDKYLVIIYMLITWYYTRRENKLYTDECTAYQPMLETCFLLGESLIAQLSRPQPIDYKIFEQLLNLETKNLASSAKKLHSTLLKLIPYAHLGLALSEEDFNLIDIATKFVNQFPTIFGANREGIIKDAMIEALIEYRGTNKSLLLIMTLWQAVLRHVPENMIKTPDNTDFIMQADHWQRRVRMAIEGGEKAWPVDLKDYLPTESQLKVANATIKNLWMTLQTLSPEFSKTNITMHDSDTIFTALSNEHLNQLSKEEAQQELKRYLTFIFASQLTLAQEYLDELTHHWECHGQMAMSAKILIMLLECYELNYRSEQDIGVDKVYALKKRFENKKYALHHADMPESIQNRSMAVGYSRLRMVLFSVATPTTPKKTLFGTPTRK